MENRTLGTSELKITPVGLGTWAIGGGDNPHGWGPQDDGDSIRTIHRALDLGINWIETAAGYGHGHSEEVVGMAIASRRDEVMLATKCGLLWKEDGSDIYVHLKADSIKREAEASLKRLNTDVIDLYQIHWPGDGSDIEEGWSAIAELVSEGKIRYGGVSNFSVEQMQRIQTIMTITSLQPPYSMLERGAERKLLPFCAEQNIGVIVYSPMQAGLLAGKFTKERVQSFPDDDWRRNSTHFQEPALSANLELVDGLKEIAGEAGKTVAQLAVAWTLRRPAVTGAIVGARQPAQIEETVQAAERRLSDDEIDEIERLLAAKAERAG
jgi:aryl-alcohol dehydrogenase-like predicted oxidoreductase